MIYRFKRMGTEHHNWFDKKQPGDIVCISDYDTTHWAKILSISNDPYDYTEIILTDDINKWLREHNIKFPFVCKEEEMLFLLTFG